MTDRDKLKELLKQAQDKYFELYSEYARDSEGKTIESFEDFCADHLLANGVIVPPCKVGDKVYKITRNKVKECEVVFIGISIKEKYSYFNSVENYADGTFYKSYSMDFDVIGKTVFLTREEAERKLKEREKNGN
jgi:hypothetical protein